MRTPKLVGELVEAIAGAVSVPVTVKCRLGVDEQDTEEALDGLADAAVMDRMAVVEAMLPYIAAGIARGGRLGHVTRHMLGLFNGEPGARTWRRILTEGAVDRQAGVEVVHEALAAVAARAGALDNRAEKAETGSPAFA
jgi:tRNA-dihydrouridine synthase